MDIKDKIPMVIKTQARSGLSSQEKIKAFSETSGLGIA